MAPGASGHAVSFWINDAPPRSVLFPALTGQVSADVCIIGGGLTGLLSAYTLHRAGQKVVLLEARDVGGSTSGYSTAKVSTQHNLIYSKLNAQDARNYAAANQAGLELYDKIRNEYGIECEPWLLL